MYISMLSQEPTCLENTELAFMELIFNEIWRYSYLPSIWNTVEIQFLKAAFDTMQLVQSKVEAKQHQSTIGRRQLMPTNSSIHFLVNVALILDKAFLCTMRCIIHDNIKFLEQYQKAGSPTGLMISIAGSYILFVYVPSWAWIYVFPWSKQSQTSKYRVS